MRSYGPGRASARCSRSRFDHSPFPRMRPRQEPPMSCGCIACIVVLCIAVVCLIVGGVYLCLPQDDPSDCDMPETDREDLPVLPSTPAGQFGGSGAAAPKIGHSHQMSDQIQFQGEGLCPVLDAMAGCPLSYCKSVSKLDSNLIDQCIKSQNHFVKPPMSLKQKLGEYTKLGMWYAESKNGELVFIIPGSTFNLKSTIGATYSAIIGYPKTGDWKFAKYKSISLGNKNTLSARSRSPAAAAGHK